MLTHHAHQVGLTFSATRDTCIRIAATDHAHRLADRKQTARFSAGDGVGRTLTIMNDGHVTRQHVGQILEHPQRRQILDALAAPATDVKLSVRAARGSQCAGEFVLFSGNQPSADVATEATGRNRDRLLLM